MTVLCLIFLTILSNKCIFVLVYDIVLSTPPLTHQDCHICIIICYLLFMCEHLIISGINYLCIVLWNLAYLSLENLAAQIIQTAILWILIDAHRTYPQSTRVCSG